MSKEKEVNMIMAVELLADLDQRTGREGPFQANYKEDRATCKAILDWLAVDRYTWERLRLLLNYVHDRGVRLGAERARAVIMGNVLGGAVHREFTLWGRKLTGLDMEDLSDWYKHVANTGFEDGIAAWVKDETYVIWPEGTTEEDIAAYLKEHGGSDDGT